MNKLRRALGACVVASLLWTAPVCATSFTTDQSDIYNAVNDAGWAVEFGHRGSAMFAVLYVHDQSTDPVWYSATLTYVRANPDGSLVWSGDLFATKGPWFATVPFNS